MATARTRRRKRVPVPRKRPTQERAAFTVDVLVTAVERVLEQHGTAGLSTNRIAEVAGVSVGTLYQYFPNKEALVAAVQARYLEITVERIRAVLVAAATVPLPLVIERMAEALVGASRQLRPIHRWLADLRSAAAFQDRFRDVLALHVDDVAAFLAARADVRFSDTRAAAYVLVHAVNGIVIAAGDSGGTIDVEAVAAAAVRMVNAYIAAP